MESKADLLLMDETLGRRYAGLLNVRTMGIIGLLRLAKDKRLIPEIKSPLNALRDKTGFWIKEELYKKILSDAGEE